MHVQLTREFRFEAAHLLPKVPPGHKCQRLHGHSFKVEISLEGPVDPEAGWFVDFDVLPVAWQPLHDKLDHRFLNEVPGLENPTSENLARYIWDALVGVLPGLACVTVHETCDSRCAYSGR